jgi:tetratricopeptide (TPR) repeat protein
MLSRLEHSLSLLTGGQYDLPERQRTLRGTIEWSHDLLDERVQALFRRLSVFQGGRSLDAVEAVCAGGLPGSGVLDGLTSLADMNLLREEEGVGGEPRYWMLETIHEYARERLEESGEAGEMRLGHADFFLSLAERGDPYLRSGQQREWLDRLEEEHDNFRTALAWCARGEEYERVELGLRLVAALYWFWVRSGRMAEGRRWIDSALFRAEGVPGLRHSLAAARALSCAGVLAYLQGDRTGAEPLLDESLTLYRQADGDPPGLARTLVYLGIVKGYMGRQVAVGRPLVEEGLAILRTLDDRWELARAIGFLGFLPMIEGDYAKSRALFAEALPLFEQTGDPWAVCWSKVILGEAARCMGDYEAAAVLDRQALAIQRDLGDKHSMAITYNNLGYVALARRDYPEAARCLAESIRLFDETGSRSRALSGLAGFAAIALAGGRLERAARLFGAASALGEAGRLTLEPSEQLVFERNLAALRERMDDAALQPAWSEGRAMTWEQAFAYATGADDTSPPAYPSRAYTATCQGPESRW